MSVQNVKNNFQELSAYLARDVAGLDKLRNLKDAVNVLRTRLAAAEEKESAASGITNGAIERALVAERETEATRIENNRLQQQVAALTLALKNATVATEPDEDGDDVTSGVATESELKSVIKHLRKNLRYCPDIIASARVTKPDSKRATIAVHDRESFATGWSHESLWTLGASVAVLAAYGGGVAITSKHSLRDIKMEDRNSESGAMRPVIQWLSTNIDFDATTGRAGPVRLVNLNPKAGLVPERMEDVVGTKHPQQVTTIGVKTL